jgi:hypothetical protein
MTVTPLTTSFIRQPQSILHRHPQPILQTDGFKKKEEACGAGRFINAGKTPSKRQTPHPTAIICHMTQFPNLEVFWRYGTELTSAVICIAIELKVPNCLQVSLFNVAMLAVCAVLNSG